MIFGEIRNMRRIIFLVVAINMLITAFILRTPYRRFILDGTLEPSSFADYACTLFFTIAVPFIVFFFFSPATKTYGIAIIALCTILGLIFELYQMWNAMVYDNADMLSILFGGLIAVAILHFSFKAEYK